MCQGTVSPSVEQPEQHAIPAHALMPFRKRQRLCRRCGNEQVAIEPGEFVCPACPVEYAMPLRVIDNPLLSEQVRLRILERDIRQLGIDNASVNEIAVVLADRCAAIRKKIST